MAQRAEDGVAAADEPYRAQIEGEQRRILEKVLDESFVRSFRVAMLVAAGLADERAVRRPDDPPAMPRVNTHGPTQIALFLLVIQGAAQRYDTQVEVLFNGTANVTRRQALPQLHEVFTGRDQRQLRLLDAGCGKGRFLDFGKQAWLRLTIVSLDSSETYVREAKRHLERWSRIHLVVANGESIPVPDESQDAVTSIFAFHELPP